MLPIITNNRPTTIESNSGSFNIRIAKPLVTIGDKYVSVESFSTDKN